MSDTKDNNLVPYSTQVPARDLAIGQAANQAATGWLFHEYRMTKAPHTIRRQDADLALFTDFLVTVQMIRGKSLRTEARAWEGITWGLVDAFVKWQLKAGYTIGSIGVRLSTVKVYARLAWRAGVIPDNEHMLIQAVKAYSGVAGERVDQHRKRTRIGTKKAQANVLTPGKWRRMMALADGATVKGARDRMALALMFELGLRASETAALNVDDYDQANGTLKVYRIKTHKHQTLRLKELTRRAIDEWLDVSEIISGPMVRRMSKHEVMTIARITTRGLCYLARQYGALVGIPNLSPHDGRHSRSTARAAEGASLVELRDEMGHSKRSMTPLRYMEQAHTVDMVEAGQ
jgi:integrase